MGQSAEELRRDIERTREGLGETLDAIGDRVSPGRIMERRKNRVTYGLRNVKDRVMGTVGDTTSTISDRMHSVGDGAGDVVGHVREMPGAVRHQTQGAPVMAGAIAFGVGFLVAAVFPPSQAEKDAGARVMEKVEPLKGELAATGKEMAEHLKEPAMEAANELKDAAKESAQSVTDTAKTAAHDTADQAKSAATTVQQDAEQARSNA